MRRCVRRPVASMTDSVVFCSALVVSLPVCRSWTGTGILRATLSDILKLSRSESLAQGYFVDTFVL